MARSHGLRGTVAALAAVTALTGCGEPDASWTAAPVSPASPVPDPVAVASSPTAAASPVVSPAASATVSSPVVPAGVTAGIVVYDRTTRTFTVQRNATQRFRSASLVKLLIALDATWDLGPGYAVPAADRARLDLMLRSSDDDAASYFYRRNGSAEVVKRMVTRLGLQNNSPPAPPRTGWGSTAVSAADMARVYRYILDKAPAPVRDLVMGNLHASTRCGTDGFDQSYGIPAAFDRPWAVKQGWYEFAGGATATCASAGSTTAVTARVVPAAGVDWDGEVLHTTGTVGAGDRTIVVVLTVHRPGTSFAKASAAVTTLARSLPRPR